MTYTRPFVTRRFIAYGGESVSRQLSLAVRVMDAFTQQPALAPMRVYLKERARARALVNQSGVFCFLGIPAGEYTLVVEPDPTTADWFYLQPQAAEEWSQNFERQVTLPLPDPKLPLLVVTLSPKSSYPFPQNATLVRGTVSQGAPPAKVASAVVGVDYEQVDPDDTGQTIPARVETQTDRNGEYVLFFQRLPANKQQVTVKAVKDGQQAERQLEIQEGATQMSEPLTFP